MLIKSESSDSIDIATKGSRAGQRARAAIGAESWKIKQDLPLLREISLHFLKNGRVERQKLIESYMLQSALYQGVN
ncbi:MAG: hypothetical protein II747_02130, partial [Clostridia bacterium]|nr:hypothetical protein [Clostridia bacterium]